MSELSNINFSNYNNSAHFCPLPIRFFIAVSLFHCVVSANRFSANSNFSEFDVEMSSHSMCIWKRLMEKRAVSPVVLLARIFLRASAFSEFDI